MLCDEFSTIFGRIGKMLMGECAEVNESNFFELLLFANEGMYMCTSDGLGVSNTVEFDLELNDDFVKPVCHDVRKYNRLKLEFIDSEV